MDKCFKDNRTLYLNLNLPLELTEIPFEILYHNGFISMQPNVHIIRKVADKTAELNKENRPLKILFIAASPIDLEHSTLQFEKEEDLIFKVTEKFPIDFQVEDTGSLEGLEQTLSEIKAPEVLYKLSELFLIYGVPDHIRSDNGSEFSAKSVRSWLESLGVKTLFIDPGSL